MIDIADVEAGRPLSHTDVTPDDLPLIYINLELEAGLEPWPEAEQPDEEYGFCPGR